MDRKNAHILVFDSGVGGLSVAGELRALMPDIYLSYVADDAFRPYGEKSASDLKARLPGLLQTLCLMLNPDIVVIACNTASTTALVEIRAVLDIPVIGVVPAVKPAAALSKTKTIAVLGTPGTVKRKYVDQLIRDFAHDCQVILHGSSVLVALAEDKLRGRDFDQKAIAAEIAPLFAPPHGGNIDVVVLACTHFPLLRPELIKAAPASVQWIDSGAAIARRCQSVVREQIIAQHSKGRYKLDMPQTAFSIGGCPDPQRALMFQTYGFEKTVIL